MEGIAVAIRKKRSVNGPSVFQQSVEQYVIGSEHIDENNHMSRRHFSSKVLTYKCLMKHGNITLGSDTKDFKQIAVKEHFLHPLSTNNLAMAETQFASSE